MAGANLMGQQTMMIKQTTSRRRTVRGFVEHLSVYDGATMIGWLIQTDDGRIQVYDADGDPAGIYSNVRDAARSLPKAEPVP